MKFPLVLTLNGKPMEDKQLTFHKLRLIVICLLVTVYDVAICLLPDCLVHTSCSASGRLIPAGLEELRRFIANDMDFGSCYLLDITFPFSHLSSLCPLICWIH